MYKTYGIRRESCRSDTHREVVEPHSSSVPVLLVSTSRRLEPSGTMKDWTYEFYRNLLAVQEVCALENDTKGAFTNLPAHPVVHPNDVR